MMPLNISCIEPACPDAITKLAEGVFRGFIVDLQGGKS
jgi:hypothetical protein